MAEKQCLKCGHINVALNESDPFASCPGCGAIYARVEAAMQAGQVIRRAAAPPPPPPLPTPSSMQKEPPAAKHEIVNPFDVQSAIDRGDWAAARLALQKHAYGILDASDAVKREFAALVARFTQIDPLYRDCMAVVRPLVAARPGLRQTELYAHLPVSVEDARYVLYFAAELGHVFRRKKGNSYEVFPPR